MKNIISLLFLLMFAFNSSNATEPCNCKEYHQNTLEFYQKGDVKSILKATADFYLGILDQRIITCDYYLNDKGSTRKQKSQLQASISSLTKLRSEVYRAKNGVEKLTFKSHGDYKAQLYKIQGRAGEVLKVSSDVLYGNYHGDEIPPPLIIGIGVGRCEEGESPPNHDCGYIAGKISKSCNDGIDEKMRCGYYNDFGSIEEAQAQLEQDQQACIRAAETQQESCQQANRDCDHNFDPMRDMYDFLRQAQQHCSLRDMLTNPAETQSAGGN